MVAPKKNIDYKVLTSSIFGKSPWLSCPEILYTKSQIQSQVETQTLDEVDKSLEQAALAAQAQAQPDHGPVVPSNVTKVPLVGGSWGGLDMSRFYPYFRTIVITHIRFAIIVATTYWLVVWNKMFDASIRLGTS